MKTKGSDLNSPKTREKIQQLAQERGISFNEARKMMMKKHSSM